MNASVAALRSSTQLTEDDLQAVLAERDACEAAGNKADLARTLLVLAHVVKWVRSDNAEPPFVRAHTLAVHALALFREVGDKKGEVDALLDAAPMDKSGLQMLGQALEIAEKLGDGRLIAYALERQGAKLALSNAEAAIGLTHRALAIFEKLGNEGGQARCLFGLANREVDQAVRWESAIKAAELYCRLGSLDQAARSLQIGFWRTENAASLGEQERLALLGLSWSQECGKTSMEGSFYFQLTRIAALQGDVEKAERYRRWHKELEEASGESPKETEKMFKKMLAAMPKDMQKAWRMAQKQK